MCVVRTVAHVWDLLVALTPHNTSKLGQIRLNSMQKRCQLKFSLLPKKEIQKQKQISWGEKDNWNDELLNWLNWLIAIKIWENIRCEINLIKWTILCKTVATYPVRVHLKEFLLRTQIVWWWDSVLVFVFVCWEQREWLRQVHLSS